MSLPGLNPPALTHLHMLAVLTGESNIILEACNGSSHDIPRQQKKKGCSLVPEEHAAKQVGGRRGGQGSHDATNGGHACARLHGPKAQAGHALNAGAGGHAGASPGAPIHTGGTAALQVKRYNTLNLVDHGGRFCWQLSGNMYQEADVMAFQAGEFDGITVMPSASRGTAFNLSINASSILPIMCLC